MRTMLTVLVGLLVLTLLPAAGFAQQTPLECGLPGDARCEEWVAQYDTGDTFEAPTAFAVAPSDGRTFIGGRTTTSGVASNDIHIAAFDPDGTQAWDMRYGNPGVADLVRDLTVSPDEQLVAAAAAEGYVFDSEGEAVVLVLDAETGEQRLASTFGGPFADVPTSVRFSADGETIFASAVTYNVGPDQDPDTDQLVAAFDATTGERLWQTRIASPRDDGGDWVHQLTASPDGETVFAGGYYQTGGLTIAASIAAIEVEDGDVMWLSTFTGGNPNTVSAVEAIEVAPDGRTVFATGYSQEPGQSFGVLPMTLAYDASSGNLRWSDRFSANGQRCVACTPVSIAVSPSGDRVFVASDATMTNDAGVPSRDLAAVAYDAATGSRAWVSTYDSLSRHQYAARVALSEDGGRVHVAGITYVSMGSAGSHTSPTVATFDAATGDVLWDAMIGAPVVGPRTDPAVPLSGAAAGRFFMAFAHIQPRTSTAHDTNYGIAAFSSE